MKALQFLGVLVIIMGGIWVLQGLSLIPQGNILSRSFMMGQREWALYGGIAVVAGLALFFFAGRSKV
ncbi:MAG TPA: hypothetical protein VGL66_03075 [Caulobacteraceae bacterium]|jgi:hypothetical protein